MNKNNGAWFFPKLLSSSQVLEIIMNHRRAKHNIRNKVYSDLFPHLVPVSILQFKENNCLWQHIWMQICFLFQDSNSDEASIKEPGFKIGPALYLHI